MITFYIKLSHLFVVVLTQTTGLLNHLKPLLCYVICYCWGITHLCIIIRSAEVKAHLATVQGSAFSGPSAWNDLPVGLRSLALLMARPSKFYISLKSFFFGRDWAGSASE